MFDTRSSESRFVDAWIGANYQFKKAGNLHALLDFSEMALAEKHRVRSSFFNSGLVGLTAYKALYPMFPSLTNACQFNKIRKNGDAGYKPGNPFLLNPSIDFTVNEKVTLSTQLQCTNQNAEKLDGAKHGSGPFLQ